MKRNPTSSTVHRPTQPVMEEIKQNHQEQQAYNNFGTQNFVYPSDWFSDLMITLQANLLYNCFLILSCPFLSLYSMASESYHRAEETTEAVESAVQKVPSNVTHGSTVLLKKLGFGLLGAAHVCMVLLTILILATAIGVGLVQFWVEEPVFVRERLHFDYTEFHPKALFTFRGRQGFYGNYQKMKQIGIPIGHTSYVSLVLLLPESEFNRNLGVFQLSAELLSTNGKVIAKSSQPCMLRFRSYPVRLARTFMFGVPLLLGISGETQKITIQMLKHKEGYLKTEAIRVTMIPRAGTSSLPQLYEADILMNSQLPWTKELVRRWKWTFYVWLTLYTYILLLILLFCCCKSIFFPILTSTKLSESREREVVASEVSIKERGSGVKDDEEVSELIRKWKQRRSKRKASYTQGDFPETEGSSASTISITRDDDMTSTVAEEDVGDSESVCLGG